MAKSVRESIDEKIVKAEEPKPVVVEPKEYLILIRRVDRNTGLHNLEFIRMKEEERPKINPSDSVEWVI